MAKKQTTKAEVEQPKENTTVELDNLMRYEKPGKDKVKPTWEIKDRTYFLTGNKSPLSYQLRSSGIYYFDEEKGYERELKNTSNQRTPFVDEMVGDQRLEHIVFRNGSLFVPKNKTVLQKLLSLYHPHKGNIYEEHKPLQEAADMLDWLELETEALITAKSLDIDKVEAILRAENGSRVSKMSSKELKRDILLMAKESPLLFLELANDDNVILRDFGIKATEKGILLLSQDQRTFSWASNGRKLLTVPFDEHPYSALAQWFKTDEGMEIYANIEKRLNM